MDELSSDRPELLVWRSSARRHLVLLGLTGFAISQPLLAVLGDNPITLAFHGVGPAELVALAMIVGLGPPLVLIGVTAVTSLVRASAGRIAYLVAVAALVACALVQWAKAIGDPPTVVLVLLALAGAVAFTIAHVRVPAVTAWTSYTAILPFLAIGTFLLTSPSSVLLQTTDSPEQVRSDAPSVVLIVLDELPTRSLVDSAGQLDAARYPNLAAFAGDATWYRHHTTMAAFTENAVPSLLTGSDPKVEQPIWTSYEDNLFTLLAPTHDLEVMEVATRLCPYDECQSSSGSVGPGFRDLLGLTRDIWVDRVSPGDPGPSALDDFNEAVEPEPQRSAPSGSVKLGAALEPGDEEMQATSERANTFRATFDSSDPSTLYYLHLLLPHQPWRFRPDGSLYGDSDYFRLSLPPEDRFTTWSRWDSIVGEQRHVLQMQYVDALLGQIFDDLRATGVYDDSLVIVTADHGISFEEHTPPRELSDDTFDTIAYTPLLVKRPGQSEGAIDDSNVMMIDVLPTIADEVGVDLDFPVDGQILGSPALAERGSTKRFLDLEGPQDQTDEPPLELDDRVEFPSMPDHHLGPLTDPDDPLSAMQELLPVRGLIGARLDELDPRSSEGSLAILHLDRVQHPTGVPYGVVIGRVDGASDGMALLVVDGVVVAGSELSTDSAGVTGRTTFLLPAGALDGDNVVRAAIVTPGGVVRELEVTGT